MGVAYLPDGAVAGGSAILSVIRAACWLSCHVDDAHTRLELQRSGRYQKLSLKAGLNAVSGLLSPSDSGYLLSEVYVRGAITGISNVGPGVCCKNGIGR